MNFFKQCCRYGKKSVLSLGIVLLSIGMPILSAAQRPAAGTIDLKLNGVTLEAAFAEIRRSSGLTFAYGEHVDRYASCRITVAANDLSVDEAIEKVLSGTDLGYTRQGNRIMIHEKPASPAQAQPAAAVRKPFAGRVVDTEGNPIPGVTVVETGKNNGTITDSEGRFRITVSPEAVLHVSFLGYKTAEIAVETTSSTEFTLTEEVNELEQVVAIGYGSTRKADLTGAVASVEGDRLAGLQATSVSQALQGVMPGVQVTRESGMPGAEASIRIRGVTSIGDSDPLIIVDGIPGDLNLNVEDIESISVLKDAASASIYGARAAAGVILITTKRAREGSNEIEYSGSVGFVRPTAYPEGVDYKSYMHMINELTWNEAGNLPDDEDPVYPAELIEQYAELNRTDPDAYPITDWRAMLINRSAPTTRHNLSVSYGNDIVRTNVSGGYEKTDALYDNRSFTATSVRMNNRFRLNGWLSISADASYRRTDNEQPIVNPLRASYLYGPLWTPVWSDGRISGGREGANAYAQIHHGGFDNTWRDNMTGKFALEFTPLKNLTITGVYAPNIYLTKGKRLVKKLPWYTADDPTQPGGYISGNLETSLTEARGEVRTETTQLLANYATTLASKHNFSLMAGYEDFYSFTETLGTNSNGMELSEYPYMDRANLNDLGANGTAYENVYRSVFGRVGYDYDGRYLFQANIRLDNSSRFAKDYRLGVFPSFSAGWVVTGESFMRGVSSKALPFLKLRASWGSLGNERIGNYPYQATMDFENVVLAGADGSLQTNLTAAQQTYNVRDITWETTRSWNVGLDAVLLDNRLSVTADYYKKMTEDMLLNVQLPLYMGYQSPEQNAGKMHTTGYDLSVGWRERVGDFRYAVSANLSNYKSTMGELKGTEFEDAAGTISLQGAGYKEWFGYVSDGLYLTQDQIDNGPVQSGAKVGDVSFRDVSGPEGTPDGLISADHDRVLLGSSLPRCLYGGTIDLGWKGIDLSVVMQGVGKHTARVTSDMVYQTSAWHNFPNVIEGKYFSHHNTPEQNAAAIYPRLSTSGYTGNNYKMSDFWLFNGAYFRIKNVTLSYTLPSKWVDRLQLQDVRIHASVSDPFSIDNYLTGWDPEAKNDGSAYVAQTWNFGVAIKF